MIYIILLILAIFFNAIMDSNTLDVFGRWAEKRYKKNPTKFNKILWEWVDADAWENKYKIKDWLISLGIPTNISTWLAKDVLVIFLDLWHFAKALMMICFEIPISILLSPLISIIPIWVLLLGIFLCGGILFNFFYYNLNKI